VKPKRRHVLNVLAAVGLLLGWFVFLRPASLGGPASYLLVQGHSMDGTLAIGDLVVVTRQDDYRAGELVVFEAPVQGSRGEAYVVHRIISVDADGRMQTQGDNNPYVDAWTITADDVVGEMRVRIPHFAVVHTVFLWLFRPWVIGALVGLFAFLLIGTDDDEPGPDDDGTDGGPDPDADVALPDIPTRTSAEREPAHAARSALLWTVRPVAAAVIAVSAVLGPADRASAAELMVASTAISAHTFTCTSPATCTPI